MSTITTRSGKGSPLTHNEVDANFTNLNTDKLQSGDTAASLTVTSADINGGTIDGTVIGGSTPAAATFSSLVANSLTYPTTDGTSGQAIITDGSGALSFGDVSGGGGITYVTKTANYTTSAGEGVIADTSGGAFTITLPASPSTGDQVIIADGSNWATTNLTVGRNGSTIEGVAADLTCDVEGISVTMVYDGSTWQLYPQTGTSPSLGIDDNATSTAITIDASQNVGIGTSSPASFNSSGNDLVVGNGVASNDTGITVYTNSNATGHLLFADGTSGASAYAGYIRYAHANDFMAFHTNAGAERLRIDSSGNVGIGTSSPSEQLHIANANDAVVLVESTGSDATDDANIQLKTTNGTFTIQNDRSIGTSGALTVAGNTSNNLVIDHNSGNVGIGTSSPQARLDFGTSAANLGDPDDPSLLLYNNGSTIKYGFNVSNAQLNYITPVSGDSHVFHNIANGELMRIDSSGNLLVGATSTASGPGGIMLRPNVSNGSGLIDIDRTSTTATSEAFLVRNGGIVVGKISYNNTTTTYSTSSDYRLKENVVDLDNGIDRLKQIPVHRFNFIADPDTTVDGFIAHEVQDVVPEAITGAKDAVDAEGNPEYQGIDQSKLVPLLTAALQEAVAKIEDLESRLSALEAN